MKHKEQRDIDAGNPLANKERDFVSRFWSSPELEKEYTEAYFFDQPETSRIKELIGDDWDFYIEYKKNNLQRISIISDFVKSSLSSGSKILDLGCSSGQVGYNIEQKGIEVTGIDLNKKSIEMGRKILKGLNSNITLIHGDALFLPINENSFNAVVACDVIEHIPDQQRFLNEIYRVLKPNGTMFLNTDNDRRVQAGVMFRRLIAILKGQNPLKWKHAWAETEGGHCALTTPKSIAKIAKGIGFKNINIKYWGEPIPLCKSLLSPNFLFTAEK